MAAGEEVAVRVAAVQLKGRAELMLAAALLVLLIEAGRSLAGIRGLGWLYLVAIALVLMFIWPDSQRRHGHLLRLFKGCGLYARIDDRLILPRVVKYDGRSDKAVYILTLPPGLSSKDFEAKNLALSEGMNAKVSTKFEDGRILMHIDRSTPVGMRSG